MGHDHRMLVWYSLSFSFSLSLFASHAHRGTRIVLPSKSSPEFSTWRTRQENESPSTGGIHNALAIAIQWTVIHIVHWNMPRMSMSDQSLQRHVHAIYVGMPNLLRSFGELRTWHRWNYLSEDVSLFSRMAFAYPKTPHWLHSVRRLAGRTWVWKSNLSAYTI